MDTRTFRRFTAAMLLGLILYLGTSFAQPLVLHIEKAHNGVRGNLIDLSIYKVSGDLQMGGFNLAVTYNDEYLSFVSARMGSGIGPGGSSWEYFSYSYGTIDNCDGYSCSVGKVRLTAIADINNGGIYPSYSVPDGAELAVVTLYVPNNIAVDCQFFPVRFLWTECGDNTIPSATGDTSFISINVFDYLNTDPLTDPNFNITGVDCGFSVRFGGTCPECIPSLSNPLRNIYFWNGGVDVPCDDSGGCMPGDLNHNGIAAEIGDLLLYESYFEYGAIVCGVLPCEDFFCGSDVNGDGIPLTVGDMVYMIRMMMGDLLVTMKRADPVSAASVEFSDGLLASVSSEEIGAMLATFRVRENCQVVPHTDMEVRSHYDAAKGELRVLVWPGTENMNNRIAAGSNRLFSIIGDAELISVEAADYYGRVLEMKTAKSSLPTEFALLQNTPNPFNPTTKIGLNLPTVSDWSLNIYNVAGQLVKSFNGRGIGSVTVDVDASQMASGIYFYKATAGSLSDTKKMVVLK